MAVTPATFRVQFPEFTNLGDDYVAAKLANAAALCPVAVWGDFADQGTALQAAQQLALSPSGRDLKLVNDDGRTVYDKELQRLRLIVSSGGRVV